MFNLGENILVLLLTVLFIWCLIVTNEIIYHLSQIVFGNE